MDTQESHKSPHEIRIEREREARSDSLNNLLLQLHDRIDELSYGVYEWRVIAGFSMFLAFTTTAYALYLKFGSHL